MVKNQSRPSLWYNREFAKAGFSTQKIIVEINHKCKQASLTIITPKISILMRCEVFTRTISIKSQPFIQSDGNKLFNT